MDGYYDYFPQVELDRHVLIGGFITADNRTVGYRLSSLTGLPFADLDRRIEHSAGMSVWELVLTRGVDAYRGLERQILRRELDARPFGIISLGDGALIDPALRRQVLERSHLVFLELDLANCYWRLKSSASVRGDFWHPLYATPLDGIDRIRAFFDTRRAGLEEAPHRVDITGRKLYAAVEVLRKLLPELRDGSV